MDNATRKLCDTANYLAHNTQLTVMVSLRAVVAAVGLCLFGVLFKAQGTHLAFHSNARLLLISHHIWVVLQALTNLLAHSFSLIRFAMNFTGPCDYMISMTTSLLLRGPIVFTVYGQVWALAAMAVERCYATYRYRDYEKRDCTPGKLLIAIQVQ
uniref:Vomeronasal type-1 receptor n=1 Tax=Plectus sambesii TaxID=2011161 RepID=A0A914XCW2_9BILA